MPPTDASKRRPDEARKRVQRLARLMDSSIRLPGGFRIGVDGLIGLVPGIGDLATAGVSFYIIVQAVRAGVPTRVLTRMALNVGLNAPDRHGLAGRGRVRFRVQGQFAQRQADGCVSGSKRTALRFGLQHMHRRKAAAPLKPDYLWLTGH